MLVLLVCQASGPVLWSCLQELMAAKAKTAEAASQLSAAQAQHMSELAREAQSKRDLHERSACVEEVTVTCDFHQGCMHCPQTLSACTCGSSTCVCTFCAHGLGICMCTGHGPPTKLSKVDPYQNSINQASLLHLSRPG